MPGEHHTRTWRTQEIAGRGHALAIDHGSRGVQEMAPTLVAQLV